MQRVLSNVVVLLSLLLCVASVALLVRSYFVSDWISFAHISPVGQELLVTDWILGSGKGNVALDYIFNRLPLKPDESAAMYPGGVAWVTDAPADPADPRIGRFGFGYESWNAPDHQPRPTPAVDLGYEPPGAYRSRHVSFPLWLPATLFALPPALWLRRRLKRRRGARAGHCPRCGYDLRATPEKCPECGEEPGCAA